MEEEEEEEEGEERESDVTWRSGARRSTLMWRSSGEERTIVRRRDGRLRATRSGFSQRRGTCVRLRGEVHVLGSEERYMC